MKRKPMSRAARMKRAKEIFVELGIGDHFDPNVDPPNRLADPTDPADMILVDVSRGHEGQRAAAYSEFCARRAFVRRLCGGNAS